MLGLLFKVILQACIEQKGLSPPPTCPVLTLSMWQGGDWSQELVLEQHYHW